MYFTWTSTYSNFQFIFDNALKAYKERTKGDPLTYTLANQLEACNSASSVLTVLHEQVQELNGSQRNNRNTKWLGSTVNVLHAFSDSLGEGVGSVSSPAKVIFIGFGVLISTAKAVRPDQDALFKMFERIESFFRRLDAYTNVASNQGMVDTIAATMMEVLDFIGIATEEIKQGRMKKYLKKLIGKNDAEYALKRLDRLTQEVAQLAAAQPLKTTNMIDNVEGIADNVLFVDSRVASIDDKGKVVDDKLGAVRVIDDGKEARGAIQQAADGVDRMERNQLRPDLRRWLSPPDPSANHNIARNAHHKGTASWFLGGSMYKEWKSTGSESLLWIHGKPGSGKTILCSAIVEDIKAMCGAGQSSMGFFYIDYRDINKQHWRDVVSSLLIQLSENSGPRCDVLSSLCSDYDGAQQPNDDILAQCLEEMLTVPDQHPIYLIFDALDESSNVSGTPTPHKRVLQLVKELVDLHIPNLHICVTSRPEVDIRNVLEPLTSRQVSLHDQSGQKRDIEGYVRSVVYSDSEPIMRRWKKGDKELVIESLSKRADGIFLWIFCQLEVLRGCIPSNVRRTLMELPESLDETYERILKEIEKPDMTRARRVLQCLVVAIRPLRVAELAEVLAVEFDDAEGIPTLKLDWRWEGLALPSACSSLIEIVQAGDSRVVQFSHSSAKEFLTAPRLATASGEISNYHIDLEPAHTILARACLGVLLQIRDGVEGRTPEDHPLARYAAEHWVTHAKFGELSSRLHRGMGYLFDPNKPHFNVWLTLCDIDAHDSDSDATFNLIVPHRKSRAGPLYYAALCGFYDLVEHLITKHPQDVNADRGNYVRPLVAALAGGHFETADLLRRNGADLDIRGQGGRNPLHAAAYSGNLEVVRILIEYDPAYVNIRDEFGWTPLHWASEGRNFKDGSVARLLLEHGADINAQSLNGLTPLHSAAMDGEPEVVRLLLEHGADVEVEKKSNGKTALQFAGEEGHDEVVELLRGHGAK